VKGDEKGVPTWGPAIPSSPPAVSMAGVREGERAEPRARAQRRKGARAPDHHRDFARRCRARLRQHACAGERNHGGADTSSVRQGWPSLGMLGRPLLLGARKETESGRKENGLRIIGGVDRDELRWLHHPADDAGGHQGYRRCSPCGEDRVEGQGPNGLGFSGCGGRIRF
jgi:hypothetical protein